MARTIFPGKPYPQGSTWDGTGVNFAIYSEHATGIELCLFDSSESTEPEIIPIRETTGFVWHCYISGLKLGQIYGFRVQGPYEPEKGLRFNGNKLLIDPYAKALTGEVNYKAPIFGYELLNPDQDLKMDTQCDWNAVPKCVVSTNHYDWENDRPPMTQLHDSVIYEVHVKGFTKMHPGLPEEIRGTYAGISHPVTIDYLKKLGITAVELMPVHAFVDEGGLAEKGLRNYWGYNSINFFSPEARYCSADLGSTLVARQAGKYAAADAAIVMTTAAASNTAGSTGFTRNSNAARSLDDATAPAIPIASPIAVTTRPSRMTMRRIAAASAPSAMRIPNSRVRSRTP